MTTPAPPPVARRPGGGRGALAALVMASLVDAAFFFSFWGKDAAGLGRRDAGLALALSFAVPLTFYASLVCAAAAAVGTLFAFVRGRSPMLWLAALAVALLPTAFFLILDAT